MKEDYRGQTLTSTYGSVAQRWLLIESQPRRSQARRTVNKRWLKHSEKEVKAFQKLGRREFACEADARQALETFEQRLRYSGANRDDLRGHSLVVPGGPMAPGIKSD